MLGILKPRASGLQIGVDFLPTGVAAVAVSASRNPSGQVCYCDFLPSVGSADQGKALHDWVERMGVKKSPCVSLLPKHDVQMFQLERPAVEANELKQAVSWKLRELISYDIDAAVIDLFEFPPSPKAPGDHINAVVANETVVGGYVDLINQSGLELQAIDVHDLAGLNYHQVCDCAEETVAILEFTDTVGLLTIYQNGELFVARDIKMGALDFDAALTQDESAYDKLLLELQRSLDYFESHYGAGMVQRMLIFPQTPGVERMASYLQNYVGYELDFAGVRLHAKAQIERLEPHCFAAYCAALRRLDA